MVAMGSLVLLRLTVQQSTAFLMEVLLMNANPLKLGLKNPGSFAG